MQVTHFASAELIISSHGNAGSQRSELEKMVPCTFSLSSKQAGNYDLVHGFPSQNPTP